MAAKKSEGTAPGTPATPVASDQTDEQAAAAAEQQAKADADAETAALEDKAKADAEAEREAGGEQSQELEKNASAEPLKRETIGEMMERHHKAASRAGRHADAAALEHLHIVAGEFKRALHRAIEPASKGDEPDSADFSEFLKHSHDSI